MNKIIANLPLLAIIFSAVAAGPVLSLSTTTAIAQLTGPPPKVVAPSTTVTKFVDDKGVTINYVPPRWTVIDHDNTSPEVVAIEQELIRPWAVSLCPPHSEVDTSIPSLYQCMPSNQGEVEVAYHPALDKNEDTVQRATVVNPETGLFELNLTAQTLLDYTTSPFYDTVVQKKSVPVNITNPNDGTSWQVPGLLVLLTSPTELDLKRVALYFIDHTTGYEISVNGPSGTIEPLLPSSPPTPPDPRGDSIPIHGIGLDNLPAVMDEPMKIINSISITRR